MELIKAINLGNIELVTELIMGGADVNVANKYGDRPLACAVRRRYFNTVDIVKCLIAAGADVNASDENQNTPLHLAALWSNAEGVKALISSGAGVNALNRWDETPVILAARDGDVKIVEQLLEAGAIIDMPVDVELRAWLGCDYGRMAELLVWAAQMFPLRD